MREFKIRVGDKQACHDSDTSCRALHAWGVLDTVVVD